MAHEARASVAQRWARRVLWIGFVVAMFAIWQHRELAPPVHDGIYVVIGWGQDVLEGAPETQDAIRRMFAGSSSGGSEPEFSAITRWLLDNR
ncbi:MAG: hypothetical protein AAGL23_09365 [Pseudomonadota bacterium]